MPVWKEISEYFFVDDITKFSEKLTKTAQHYQIHFLEDYGMEMQQAAEAIQIDQLTCLMPRFPKLIAKLKETVKQQVA